MLFPWKKTKGKKFSQIVTNRLQPPKHGASLMLETGFPASLADLFVKNRNRFNNHNTGNSYGNSKNVNNIVADKRKKNKKRPVGPLVAPVTFPDPGPTQFPSELSTPSGLSSGSESSLPRLCGEVVVFGEFDDVGINDDEVVVDGRCVLVAVLKMFFVVILALGVKRFAVGIALSAFLLLFMEYVSRRMGGLLAAFSSCLIGLLKRHRKLLRGCYSEAPIEEIKLDCDLAYSKASSGNSYKTNDLVSEIHVSQTSSPIRETPSGNSEFNLSAEKAKEEVIVKKNQEMHINQSKLLLSDGNNVVRATRKKSKIGSKIKKLANKLNDSKSKQKQKNKSKYDTSGFTEIDNTINQGHKVRESEVESKSTSSLPSSSSGVSSDDDRVNLEDLIYLEDSKRIRIISKNSNKIAEEESEKNSLSGGYLAILVIVLAGLVVGRALALGFSVSWFFILKFRSGTKGCS